MTTQPFYGHERGPQIKFRMVAIVGAQFFMYTFKHHFNVISTLVSNMLPICVSLIPLP